MNNFTTFAAIYVGTYEVSMKIFEMSARKKIHKVDYIKRRMELGKATFGKGFIGSEMTEELCNVLSEFARIMESYRVDAYGAFAGPFLQDASNKLFILDQIKLRTKLEVGMLSNSEHRFISYQSVACREEFDGYTKEGAAVVDIGGGSLQITLFLDGKVVTTQHLVLGTLRIKEKLANAKTSMANYRKQICELVDKEMEVFKVLYLKNCKIKYVILMGDYCMDIMKKVEKKHGDTVIGMEQTEKYLNKLENRTTEQLSEELNLTNENDPLIIPSIILVKRISEELHPEYVWVPGVNISDGIAYDYAEKNRLYKSGHDFEADVLSAAESMARRYNGYSSHVEALIEICTILFDAMKKVHGMGKRERLLLKVAAILHDCGKYISFVNAPDCSYDIIMASEIIGLSHLEREIAACAVKYNVHELAPYEELADKLDKESYMTVAKLSTILKLSNALDRSHKQKFKRLRAVLKGKQLNITVDAADDILLERTVVDAKAGDLEEIFGVRPWVRERRV